MAPAPKITPKTKPLKPYRRGETLGKASRQAKTPKHSTASHHEKPASAPTPVPSTSASTLDDENEEKEISADVSDAKGKGVEVRKSGKKGKKFATNESMLALISSLTAEKDTAKKAKLKKVKARPKASEEEQKKSKEMLKKKQLDAAKAAVSAKAKKAKAPPPGDSDSDGGKKRVSFA